MTLGELRNVTKDLPGVVEIVASNGRPVRHVFRAEEQDGRIVLRLLSPSEATERRTP